jgi:putative oxidoreductase
MMFFQKLLATHASAAVILIRLIVGAVFLVEGIQKFLYPDALGVGRFTKIGIPAPEILAPFVGVCETACGVLFLLGFLTRFAAITMIIDMLVAISTTKVPILQKEGFWSMAHEARNDWSMLLGSIFLLIVGAGAWSVDAMLARTTQHRRRKSARKSTSTHPPSRSS